MTQPITNQLILYLHKLLTRTSVAGLDYIIWCKLPLLPQIMQSSPFCFQGFGLFKSIAIISSDYIFSRSNSSSNYKINLPMFKKFLALPATWRVQNFHPPTERKASSQRKTSIICDKALQTESYQHRLSSTAVSSKQWPENTLQQLKSDKAHEKCHNVQTVISMGLLSSQLASAAIEATKMIKVLQSSQCTDFQAHYMYTYSAQWEVFGTLSSPAVGAWKHLVLFRKLYY